MLKIILILLFTLNAVSAKGKIDINNCTFSELTELDLSEDKLESIWMYLSNNKINNIYELLNIETVDSEDVHKIRKKIIIISDISKNNNNSFSTYKVDRWLAADGSSEGMSEMLLDRFFAPKDINSMNYGLTLGIQSSIENTINYIFNNASIGNIYINRNIVGAVVGVQPFGGRGLSGTGPKAGGPNYLMKFVNEKSYSYDTTAAGGNATLFMMSENQ